MPASNPGPEREEALAALDRMSTFLGAKPALRVRTEVQYDAVQPSGQKIEFGSVRTIELQRPDRARFEVTHREGERELVVFGFGRLSAAALDRRLYASVEHEGSLAEALDRVAEEYDLVTPLAELFHPGLAAEIGPRVLDARSLGVVWIEGFACDHLVFEGEGISFQLFLRRGDAPVPHRVVVDYLSSRGSPQFRAQLRDWEWPESIPDERFRLAPPSGAQRVSFPELLDAVLGPEEEDAP